MIWIISDEILFPYIFTEKHGLSNYMSTGKNWASKSLKTSLNTTAIDDEPRNFEPRSRDEDDHLSCY
ncbi:hypothetical protein TNCV_2820441 [Trichonephila clavipes]|nr:hypothetical protein TNCV_2820441 [Trichonephila clavipes]